MKNIFRFLMAAAIIFGAVSCAKEDISSSLAGGEVEVTFTANLPELGTRAYGDGLNATLLRYHVYDGANGAELEQLCGTATTTNGTFCFTLPLIKGMTYDFVLWADQNVGTLENPQGFYQFDGKIATINYDGNANDNNRDAFYGFVDGFDPVRHTPHFELRRPFAQLNAATSDKALVEKSEVELTTSTVYVQAYNKFDVTTGDVTADATLITVNLTSTDMPFKSGETLKAGYDYLSMNYLLVPKGGMTVNPKFTFKGTNGVVFEETEYTNVPLKQNFRTNILGALLTKQTEIEVEILPGFGEPAQDVVMTAADLKEQIENAPAGEQTEIVLGGDIDLNDLAGLLGTRASQPTGGLTIEKNKEIILNLAEGSTLRHTYTQTSPYALIDNYGKLTIKGNGTIVYTDNGNGGNWTSSTIWNKGTLVVEGDVTLVNNSSADVATNGYPHVIDNYSALTINGGTLTNNTNYSTIRIWCTTDEDTIVTINGGTFNGCIDFHNPSSAANKGVLTINGGTFNADTYTNCATRLLGFGADVDEMVATINGGTFNGAIALRNWSGSDLNSKVYTIHRGTFSVDPSEFVAENSFVQQANGKYVVCGVGAIVECAGAKAVIFSVNATEAKAVSVAEINLNGKNWQYAMDWAVGLGNGWALASMEDLNAIYDNRVALNDAIEADSAENALFWEGDELYIKNGSVYYAHYISSTEVPNGVDANGNEYFPNRVFFKQFNDKGYSDVLYSAFDCINKYAPLRDNYFARGVYTIAK